MKPGRSALGAKLDQANQVLAEAHLNLKKAKKALDDANRDIVRARAWIDEIKEEMADAG